MSANSPTLDQLLGQIGKTAARPLERASGLPPAVYWHDGLAALEEERIFRRGWVCPGLAAEIPGPGDYLTYSIAGDPVFCIRGHDGTIRTFANICRHRMMPLLEGSGQAKRIVCPYHAWTYGLDGRLIGANNMEGAATFKKSEICLPEVRTELWNGWIYITLNPDAAPVMDRLALLNDLVSPYAMADYLPVERQDHVWRTNWKLLNENFMEGYHLPVVHKATVGAWYPVEDTWFPRETFADFTYQTYTKDETAHYGRAHPDNTRLKGTERFTSVLPTIFPCHMYVLAPDHLWYLTLRPQGAGEIHVRFGVALAPEFNAAHDGRDARISEMIAFFDKVNAEDRAIVEGIFASTRSGFAEPGPLSWLERGIHDFHNYLARRLTGGPE